MADSPTQSMVSESSLYSRERSLATSVKSTLHGNSLHSRAQTPTEAIRLSTTASSKPEKKKSRGVYGMEKLPFKMREMQSQYDKILGPLTLFAPTYTEEEHQQITEEEETKRKKRERPVTPIEESIKAPPKVYTDLTKLVRRRIVADPNVEHLSVEGQQALASIIIGEVNGIWREIRHQVDDPFLTAEQNRELQRRITVHIVTVCQQLFHHYVKKAQILNQRGIFSGPANMSRLKAQMVLDAKKFLNILAIRRHLVADMRGQIGSSDSEIEADEKPIAKTGELVPLSYKDLIDCSRPKKKKKHKFSVKKEIVDMQRKMPDLDTDRAVELMPEVETFERYLGEFREKMEKTSVASEDYISATVASHPEPFDTRYRSGKLVGEELAGFQMKRVNSLPEIHDYETLKEELGLPQTGRESTTSLRGFEGFAKVEQEKRVEVKSVVEAARPDTRQKLNQDLQKLSMYKSVRRAKDDQLTEQEDLPPLLQAISKAAEVDGRQEMLEAQFKELEEKRLREEAQEVVEVREERHPQPATSTRKLPNQSVVRTSDIQVSERVSLTSITLQRNPTVFNELVGDIDGPTIIQLDSNLYFGKEINEVYDEIMKTLPTDHFRYDQDALVEPKADRINLSMCLSSSSLTKRRQERIINPELHHNIPAPWGDSNLFDWAKNPLNAEKLSRKKLLGDSQQIMQSGGGLLGFSDAQGLGGAGDQQSSYSGSAPSGGGPPAALEKSRAYLSWMNWWKENIETEDYLKHLATQDTDYLGVVFHFYDSDDEGSDDGRSDKDADVTRLAKIREREQKLKEMKVEKQKYTPGLWNVNSIFMGGLGRDPEVEVVEEEDATTLATALTPRSLTSRGLQTQGTTRVPPSRQNLDTRGSLAPPSRPGTYSVLRGPTRQSRISSGKSQDAATVVTQPRSIQDRLEEIWGSLQMPDALKLDMAIKYSSSGHVDRLEEAVDKWEEASHLILERESTINKLETFERLASDPDRFFMRGYRGSSIARLQEAKQRADLYSLLEEQDKKARKKLQWIKDKFNDEITFKGRPYLDKMKHDKIEMLYWLQQERRQLALDKNSAVNHQELPFKAAELPPIPTAVAK